MHDFTEQKRQLLLQYLKSHIQGEVRFDLPSRKLYSTDASHYQIQPLGVVIPKTQEDLLTAVQVALETRTPITARGGGTSLSGQSIGPGIVIDCSKYLNQIVDLDPQAKKVRVQPGLVLDHLNRDLAKHDLLFGPEVATANRATIGGMLGNNSAGARSIVYGKTGDHVLSLKGILADGTPTEFRGLSRFEWQRKGSFPNREGFAYGALQKAINENREEIDARFPKIVRRVSGYNLGAYVEKPDESRSLIPLLVGSEGTLAVITEAELNLVPKPRYRGLLVPHFESLAASLDALATCLEFKPSAVELMDSMLIDLARNQRSLKETMAVIHGHPAALLMVEFSSNDPLEVEDQVTKLQKRLSGIPGLTAALPAIEANRRDPLWNLRSAAVPLLYGMPGDQKPITFVEDTAVSPQRLPEFALRFREVLQRHGTDGAYYGHASVGCLHIRPVLNLKDPNDLKRMREIMEDITDLVLSFGGCLSGEHGDGLVRSEWNRKMYGPTVYSAFQQIKRAFDPDNLFNPGKIVNAPSMTDNLRYPPDYHPEPVTTIFDYSKQEGFFRSIELCNGAGVCRKTQGGAMCPSFRATLDEKDNTRGRANALRHAISEPHPPSTKYSPLAERWLFEVMDLCLSCKACKAECPSNVDVAKLKAEFQHAYYQRRMRPIGHQLMANIHHLNRRGAKFAGILNWINRRKWTRWLLEKIARIDRRRSLPELHRNHLRRWFARRPKKQEHRKVLLLDDCFNTFNEPEIGRAAVEVLEYANCSVELVNPICCGRALISKGFLKEAKALAEIQIPLLADRVRDGTPILGLEPSCILTLSDEWPELVPTEDAKMVASAAQLADHWLANEVKEKRITLLLTESIETHLFHGHCHQRALCGVNGTASVLKLIPGMNLTVLDAGCCGMAGSFGYEADHYDLSVKIANLALIPAIQNEPNATLIATGTSCRHQIKDLTGRRAKHPMEILRDRIKSVDLDQKG